MSTLDRVKKVVVDQLSIEEWILLIYQFYFFQFCCVSVF